SKAIIRIEGALNGTCHSVLDGCARGMRLAEAVRAAQGLGFAEATPEEDLSGTEAARKLRILARHAFGQELSRLTVEGISEGRLAQLAATRDEGEVLRLVASAWREDIRVIGSVRLTYVDSRGVLGSALKGWNALRILCE